MCWLPLQQRIFYWKIIALVWWPLLDLASAYLQDLCCTRVFRVELDCTMKLIVPMADCPDCENSRCWVLPIVCWISQMWWFNYEHNYINITPVLRKYMCFQYASMVCQESTNHSTQHDRSPHCLSVGYCFMADGQCWFKSTNHGRAWLFAQLVVYDRTQISLIGLKESWEFSEVSLHLP